MQFAISIVFAIVILGLIVSGVGLIFSGYTETKQEASEVKNLTSRVTRVASAPTRGNLLGGTGRDSMLDSNSAVDKEFAKDEERRAASLRTRGARKGTLLPSLSKYATHYTWLTRLEEDLLQARSPWRATELIAASVLATVFVAVMMLLVGCGILAIFSLLILTFPLFYVKSKRAIFYRKFDDQLADALMLMSNSLRAGFSFMQAMEMVAREAPKPISEEFSRVTQEIALGVPIAEALSNMSARLNSMDLNLVVTAVIIQREVGGALAQLLELIAEVIRERQRIKGEIRTLTTQGRMTGAILGCMPFVIAILIFMVGKLESPNDPSFIAPLIATDFGHMILIGAVLWQMIGFAIIMRIVNIRV